MSDILKFIGNGAQLNLDDTEYYAAILGESPSKGARSPVLWNAAFEKFSVSAKMHPMDVAQDNLVSVVEALRVDKRFIGGAVAVPYKEQLVPLLDELEPQAKTIGAINCIYRDGEKLVGANTDGEGALCALKDFVGESLEGKKACVMGLGGAGLAVATYVAFEVGKAGKLTLANRTEGKATVLGEKLAHLTSIESASLPVTGSFLNDLDVFINCTSVGFQSEATGEKGYDSLISSDSLQQLQDSCVVFDIIYQPLETALIHQAENNGLKVLNGLSMNLNQAVIACNKAMAASGLGSHSVDDVRMAMQ